jgi:DNA topoisomerase-2
LKVKYYIKQLKINYIYISMTTENEVLSEQYQQKTDKEHILDNPDTYIGSVENIDSNLWVFDDESNSIKLKTIEYIPGL